MKTHAKLLMVLATLVSVLSARAQPAVYPLHIGDRWQFTLIPGMARIDRDSLMPNGQRYALIHYDFEWHDRWERTAANRVYWFDTQTGQEYRWYDFSLSFGDTVVVIPHANDSTVVTFQGSGTYNLFGAMRRWWAFWVDYVSRAIDDEEMVLVTDSLGLTSVYAMWYTTSISGAIINGRQYGTVDVGGSQKPPVTEFWLEQNYPNPFNPATTIQYAIPAGTYGRTSLRVLDVLGREVGILVNEFKQAGSYTVTWDGSGCASGVYYYQLRAGGFVETKKLMLMR